MWLVNSLSHPWRRTCSTSFQIDQAHQTISSTPAPKTGNPPSESGRWASKGIRNKICRIATSASYLQIIDQPRFADAGGDDGGHLPGTLVQFLQGGRIDDCRVVEFQPGRRAEHLLHH